MEKYFNPAHRSFAVSIFTLRKPQPRLSFVDPALFVNRRLMAVHRSPS